MMKNHYNMFEEKPEYIGAAKQRRREKNARLKRISCDVCGRSGVTLFGKGDMKLCEEHKKEQL